MGYLISAPISSYQICTDHSNPSPAPCQAWPPPQTHVDGHLISPQLECLTSIENSTHARVNSPLHTHTSKPTPLLWSLSQEKPHPDSHTRTLGPSLSSASLQPPAPPLCCSPHPLLTIFHLDHFNGFKLLSFPQTYRLPPPLIHCPEAAKASCLRPCSALSSLATVPTVVYLSTKDCLLYEACPDSPRER